jgi:hypothetical protein
LVGSCWAVVSVSVLGNAISGVASNFVSIRYLSTSRVRRVLIRALWTHGQPFAALNLDAAATSGPSEFYDSSLNRGGPLSACIPARELRSSRHVYRSADRPGSARQACWFSTLYPGSFVAVLLRARACRFAVRVNLDAKNPLIGETHPAKGWSGMKAMSDRKLME